MNKSTKNLSAAPWKAEEWIHGKGAFVVRNNKGYLVAENMSEQDANLIAAAPEMYVTLEEILIDLDTFPQVAPGVDHPEVFDLKLKLRKLLSKAGGGK